MLALCLLALVVATRPVGVASLEGPTLTLVTTPHPYSAEALANPAGDNQLRALASWLALRGSPHVVLLGKDPSVAAAAALFPRVSVETRYDDSFTGVPLFNSMLQRAQAAPTTFAAVVNADILLFDDLLDAAERLHARGAPFVATVARFDMHEQLPDSFELMRPSGAGGQLPIAQPAIRDLALRNGTLHQRGGTDLWLWNNDARDGSGAPVPLVRGVVPPFVFGRAIYDNWLVRVRRTCCSGDIGRRC